MKKSIYFLLCFYLICNLCFSQEANEFKVALNIGTVTIPDFGLMLDIEPKYNLSSNSSVGLQFRSIAVLARNIDIPSNVEFEANSKGYSAFSIMVTYERYLGKSTSKFQPFIGGGVGFFKASKEDEITPIPSIGEVALVGKVTGQIGFTIRSGFEFGKFRLGLDYNLIPKSDLVLSEGITIGQVNDSYLSLSLGFTFGGGIRSLIGSNEF